MDTLTTKQTIGLVIILAICILCYGFVVGPNEVLAIKAGI